MDNLNFIPLSLIKKQEQEKIKLFKIVVLILWIACLVLYIIYTFNYDNNKISTANIKQSSIEKSSSSIQLSSKKTFVSINTLNKFLMSIEQKFNYSTVSIEDSRIDMELVVKDKIQYYEIIDLIENRVGYKILNLSPPVKYDENLKFNILIEVW